MAYIYDLVDSWNSSGTTFTAIKMNVTDTQSSASSLLIDLQKNTVSQFTVRKDGYMTTSGALIGGSGGIGIGYVGPGIFTVASSGRIEWGSSGVNSADTFLTRSSAANFRFGAADAAAPVAQTLSVQSVATGTANTAGANFTIAGSRGTGTGAGGSIIFQVAPATTNGSTPNALTNALTINSAGLLSVTPASSSNSSIHALRGSVVFPAYSFSTDINSGAFFGAYNGLNSYQISISGNLQWTVGQSGGGTTQLGAVSWAAASGNSLAAPDLFLYREDANKLALRNSTAAQTFRTYISYVDGSNYSRIAVGNIGSAYGISSEAVGSETIQAFRIRVAGNQNIWFETNNVGRSFIDYAGNFGFGTNAVGDNTYDLGFTVYGNNRPRDVGVGRNILQGSGYYQIAESTAPAAPAVDNVRIYAEDNGSGKTRLMARFASGVAVQIAIEP
ncbi:MAG: hypothetical protein [Caudoviricetes sp.]|nr:MAG: hypothetical protein [Caudoviricetes sp.]